MIDLLAAGKTLFDISKSANQWYRDRQQKKQHDEEEKQHQSEEEKMQAVLDDFRRRSMANVGNCFKAEIGSEEDRLYSKMVAKGYLVREFGNGYMLPEFRRSGGLY